MMLTTPGGEDTFAVVAFLAIIVIHPVVSGETWENISTLQQK